MGVTGRAWGCLSNGLSLVTMRCAVFAPGPNQQTKNGRSCVAADCSAPEMFITFQPCSLLNALVKKVFFFSLTCSLTGPKLVSFSLTFSASRTGVHQKPLQKTWLSTFHRRWITNTHTITEPGCFANAIGWFDRSCPHILFLDRKAPQAKFC